MYVDANLRSATCTRNHLPWLSIYLTASLYGQPVWLCRDSETTSFLDRRYCLGKMKKIRFIYHFSLGTNLKAPLRTVLTRTKWSGSLSTDVREPFSILLLTRWTIGHGQFQSIHLILLCACNTRVCQLQQALSISPSKLPCKAFCQGLSLFRFPCGFHLSDWRVMLLASFRRVCPIHDTLHSLICCRGGCKSVPSHSSLLLI